MSTLYFDAFCRFGARKYTHGQHPWSLDHLREELDHCSISGALVASQAQNAYDAMLENRRLSEDLKPYDHLYPIWSVMPHWTGETPEPDDLIAELKAQDVRSVMINPSTAGWNLRGAGSRPLLQALQRERLLTHVWIPSELSFHDLETLLDAYPHLPIHGIGAGWGQARQIVPLIMNYPNFHISFTHFQSNRMVEYLVDQGCGDRLFYASNAPEMSAGAHRAYIDWADLSETARAAVASNNLIRLLKGQGPTVERINAAEDEIMAAARQGEPLPCLTLDMHAHILDEGLHGAGGAYVMRDGDPAGVRSLGQAMGVDGIGVMSWNGTVGAHAEQGNDSVRATLDFDPDYYWGLATFDVAHEDAETMRRQIRQTYADPRFLGLKPYPTYNIRYDDPRYDPWWEYGNEHHLYAGLHPTLWYRNDEFMSICERFPNLTVVAYHAGASYEAADQCIAVAKRFPNFMCEPTLTPVCGGIIDYLVEHVGADRVMYGSDLPMRDPRQQLGWIVYSRLPLDVKLKVLGGNAKALLDRVRAHIPGRPTA